MAILLIGAGVQTMTLAGLSEEHRALGIATKPLAQLRTENEEFMRLQAQNQELDQLRRDNADLQRLRTEVGQLRAELGELEKLRAENGQLRAAFPGVTLIKDMARARVTAQAETCMNHLRQVYMAGLVWAQENGDRYPQDFLCTCNGLSTPIILRCPSDPARSTPHTWDEVAAGNVSYQLVSPGTAPSEGKVYAWCPIHNRSIPAINFSLGLLMVLFVVVNSLWTTTFLP
jgi:regulator of replication initiation timing